jgi:hypothetical protein
VWGILGVFGVKIGFVEKQSDSTPLLTTNFLGNEQSNLPSD